MVLIKLMVGYARVYRWIHECVTLGCFLCWNFGPHLLDPKMDTKLPQKLGHPLFARKRKLCKYSVAVEPESVLQF